MYTSPLLTIGIHGARVSGRASGVCSFGVVWLGGDAEPRVGTERRCFLAVAPPLFPRQFLKPPAQPLSGTIQPEKGTRPAGKAPCPAADGTGPAAGQRRPGGIFPRPGAEGTRPAAGLSCPASRFPRPAADGTRPAARGTGQKGPGQGGNTPGSPQTIAFLMRTGAMQTARQEVALPS